MDPLSIISLIGTIGSLIYGIGSSIVNSKKERETQNAVNDLNNKQLAFNTDIANKNFDLSQEQFNYQKQLNQLTMQREDTAFQRQVADLKAAGLSPLMVAGNGASATPLTSSNAPNFDVSGINQALTNAIGSYNDIFNRRIQRQQFALQSKVQAAQAFTQLAEFKIKQKQAKLEYDYLDEKLKWEKKNGFRDYDWKSLLTKYLDQILNPDQTDKPTLDPVLEKAREGGKTVTDWFDNNATYGDNNDFRTFGAVPRFSPYGHFLDDENYDNNRSTGKLLKEEALEKKNKIDLRIKDNEKNRRELYKYDDYLKSHISEENWLKADNKFVKEYLKNGHFEGHKKYFD